MTGPCRIGGRWSAAIVATIITAAIMTPDVAARANEAAVEVTPGPQDGISYRLGKHSLFCITAANDSDELRRVRTSTQIRGASAIAHSREFVLPPHSRRMTWHPIYLPHDLPSSSRAVVVQTEFIERPIDDHRSSWSIPASATVSGSLSLEPYRVVTGLIASSEDDSARRFVVEARRTQNLSDRVTLLRSDALPHFAEWLECYDQLVLASAEFVDDPAGLIAIRHWLESGGRLWVMLDCVPPAHLSALVGDDFGLTLIDRVRLAEGTIMDARAVPRRVHGSARQFSEPIDLVRIIADDGVPDFEINGWPAAWRQKVGRGSILFTTMGIRAWHEDAPGAQGPVRNARGPLHEMASEFFQPKAEPPSLPPVAERVAGSMVGYKVPGRGVVAAILGGSAATLVALAVTRRGQRHRIGKAGMAVALAVISSGAMIALGSAAQRAISPTLASVQLVEVSPARGESHSTAIVAAYSPSSVEGSISGADATGTFNTYTASGRQGGLLWTDEHRWRLDQQLPRGLFLLSSTRRAPLLDHPVISASLSDQGIIGRLNGHVFANAESAIIAAPGALPLAAKFDADGDFQAGSGDRLEVGQFDADAILGDTEAGRQQIYRELFPPDGDNSPMALNGPTLLFWTRSTDLKLTMAAAERMVGETLVSIPILVTPPDPRLSFAVPSVLLPYAAVDGPDGTPASSAYSNASGSWVDGMVTATQITLRFQTPRALDSLVIQEATLHLEVTAPSRTVRISGWHGQEPSLIQSVTSPVESLQATIRDAESLSLDSGGGLLLSINIGPHPREQEANIAKVGWSINRVWLDIDSAMIERR